MPSMTQLTAKRRQVLQMLGVSLAGTGLAACSRANTDNHGGGGGTDRVFHAAYPYDQPPKGNFNLLQGVSEAITIGYLEDLILIPGAMYYWDAQKYYYMLADPSSKLSTDGRTFTYKVKSGLKWSDGKPVTARDVYSTWLCEYVLGHSVFNYVHSFEQTADDTITFHITTPAPIAQYDILRMRPVSDAVYGDFAREAEQYVKARTPTTDKAVAALNQKIASFKPKSVTASGPFNFDTGSITNAQLKLVKNSSGYRADKIHWDSFIVYNGETTVVAPLVLAKKVYYATHGFPVATDKQFQAEGIRVLRNPTYFARGIYFNYGRHEEFRDKRFRQALAHAMKRDDCAKAELGQSGKAVVYMAGMSDLEVPKWVEQDALAKFNRYEHDPDKAAQLLTEAGWSRRSGKWYTPQGKRATYQMIYPTNFSYQIFADQLNEFGFKIATVSDQNIDPDMGAGKFDLAVEAWGSPSSPFPSDAYAQDLFVFNYPDQTPNRGMDFPLKQKTDVVGEIDLQKAVVASGVGATTDALKANVTRIALAFNELLPVLQLMERYADSPVLTSAVSGFPPDGDPIYKNSIYADNFVTFLLYDGVLKPA